MEYRVFVQYEGLPPNGLTSIQRITLEHLVKSGGPRVTDNWDNNTNCYYFDTKEQADKFEFIYRLAK